MQKKYFQKAGINWILDVLGTLIFASFLSLSFFLHFIVDLIPMCGIGGEYAISAHCGPGFLGSFVEFYLTFFSYLGIFITLFIVGAAFGSSALWAFPIAILWVGFAISGAFLAIRAIYRIATNLFRKSTDLEKGDKIFFCALCAIILLPFFILLGMKLYLAPPAFVNRSITINVWHDTFTFPREYLEDWSLIATKNPGTKSGPADQASLKRHKIPFIKLSVPYDQIDPNSIKLDRVSIKIRPHYSSLTKTEMEKFNGGILEKYKAMSFVENEEHNDWVIYKKPANKRSGDPYDIYTRENEDGSITTILKCINENYCSVKNKNYWSFSSCNHRYNCDTCPRVCEDLSVGTENYLLEYAIDKNLINNYINNQQSIISFIEKHKVSDKE